MKNTSATSHSIPGPEDIHRKVLPNGITVLSRSSYSSASVVISGYVAAGSQFDPLDKLGLAYYTALGLMRGTRQADFQTIFDRLESAGASLGFGASVHNTNFGGRALAEDLPLLLSTLSDCLRNPTFPKPQMDRLKAQILTGLAIRAQDTAEMAALEFDKLLFPEHPYGRPEDGYVETVSNIDRSDVVKFHNNHYRPANMVIVVVGAVEAEKVIELVESLFGDWIAQPTIPSPDLPTIQPPIETIF
nr:insulinase family protein [Anaerolineaceae bacterium]